MVNGEKRGASDTLWCSERGTEMDYGTLDKMVVLADLYDDEDVLCGVAIPAQALGDFIAAVERLARERFGGATFAELLDKDLNDDAARAACKRSDRETVDAMIRAAERIIEGK